MDTQKKEGIRFFFAFFAKGCLILFLLSALLACGQQGTPPTSSGSSSSSSSQTDTPTPTSGSTSDVTPVPTPTIDQQPSPTSVAPSQGPTDFALNQDLSFSNVSGSGSNNGIDVSFSDSQVEQMVTKDMQHLLFEVDDNANIGVYTGNSSQPVSASTNQNADNSTTISYSETTSSYSSSFQGTLLGNQIQVTYSAQSLSAAVVDNQDFSGGTNVSASFTTQVSWISPDAIAGPPSNGSYQLTSDGGVALSWASADNAVQYDVYRFVLTDPNGMQFLDSTTSTSYTDDSQIAQQNAQTVAGISYYIYAVGTAGIENPTYVVIAVTSL